MSRTKSALQGAGYVRLWTLAKRADVSLGALLREKILSDEKLMIPTDSVWIVDGTKSEATTAEVIEEIYFDTYGGPDEGNWSQDILNEYEAARENPTMEVDNIVSAKGPVEVLEDDLWVLVEHDEVRVHAVGIPGREGSFELAESRRIRARDLIVSSNIEPALMPKSDSTPRDHRSDTETEIASFANGQLSPSTSPQPSGDRQFIEPSKKQKTGGESERRREIASACICATLLLWGIRAKDVDTDQELRRRVCDLFFEGKAEKDWDAETKSLIAYCLRVLRSEPTSNEFRRLPRVFCLKVIDVVAAQHDELYKKDGSLKHSALASKVKSYFEELRPPLRFQSRLRKSEAVRRWIKGKKQQSADSIPQEVPETS